MNIRQWFANTLSQAKVLSGLVLAAGAALSVYALQDYWTQWAGTGSLLGRFSPRLVILLAGVGVVGLLALAGTVLCLTPQMPGASPLWRRLLGTVDRQAARVARLGWLLPAAAALLWLVLPVLFMLEPWNKVLFTSLYGRLWAAWLIILLQMFLLRAWRPRWDAFAVLCGALLSFGLVALLFNYHDDLSNSPFSLGWSEGSRLYNASLWVSRQVYGQTLPLPELHPTRYLLQSLAFLIPDASIAFHRAWQVFLWIFCNGLAAWALVRRLRGARIEKGQERASTATLLLFGLWAFLSFFEGPIYYHLILCAFFVLWGFDRAHFWRSLLVVALASVWAGISRINWYPVPGLLAVALYLLEEPLNPPKTGGFPQRTGGFPPRTGGFRSRSFWRYLLPPAAWSVVGVACAWLANTVYIRLSGNPPEVFGSALNSPLLWYRLAPNATYGPGVLLASLVFIPIVAAAAWGLLRAVRRWHILRLLGLTGLLAVFYGGGVLVSLKVGGGSNLHNLDSFIVFLIVIAGYCFFDSFASDQEGFGELHIPRFAVLICLVLPVILLFSGLMIGPEPTHKMTDPQALQWLQGMIDQYVKDDRPVLMITERQLLTYNQLKVKAFEPSYEKVFLMEMAMSGNPDYLARYVSDLKERKFSLIIAEPMNFNIQTDWNFSEENNFWVQRIEEPTVGRYKLVGRIDDQGYPIAVYAPMAWEP